MGKLTTIMKIPPGQQVLCSRWLCDFESGFRGRRADNIPCTACTYTAPGTGHVQKSLRYCKTHRVLEAVSVYGPPEECALWLGPPHLFHFPKTADRSRNIFQDTSL